MNMTEKSVWDGYDITDQIYGRKQRKLYSKGTLAALVLGTMILLGGFVAVAVILSQIGYRMAAVWLLVTGCAAAFSYVVLIINYSGYLAYAFSRDRVACKVVRKYGVNLESAWFIGISPGRDIRFFDGDSAFDIGFLSIEPGKLTFKGDISDFELRRTAVAGVEVQRINVGISIRRIIISWVDANGDPQELALEYGDGQRAFGRSKKTEALANALDEWRQNPVPEPEGLVSKEPPVAKNFEFIKAHVLPTGRGVSCLGVVGIIVLMVVLNQIFDVLTDRHILSGRDFGAAYLILIVILIAPRIWKRYRPRRND